MSLRHFCFSDRKYMLIYISVCLCSFLLFFYSFISTTLSEINELIDWLIDWLIDIFEQILLLLFTIFTVSINLVFNVT